MQPFIKLPFASLVGNAGMNVPGEKEVRYGEYSEKTRETIKTNEP